MDSLVYSIAEACTLARAGRSAVYQAINSGELIGHKRGTRTLIFASDLQRWIESLPQIEAKQAKECEAVSGTESSKGGPEDGHGGGAGKDRALSTSEA